jgi:hypothetical protein
VPINRLPIMRMDGTISSCGFERGDRFVIGRWARSPIGPTVDVMWARPDGLRILLAPDAATAEFVTSVYEFDEVQVTPVRSLAAPSANRLALAIGPLEIELGAGRPVLALPPRPLWFTRWIERPVASKVMGVRTWGTSPTGVQEWYQARSLRWVLDAAASLDGVDLGRPRPLRPACGFGFSESPARPSIVSVSPALRWP